MRGGREVMLRAGGVTALVVLASVAVAIGGSREAEALPPKSLRAETPLPTPPPGAVEPMLPPPLSIPTPREEPRPPAKAQDEGSGCGRSFHTPFEGRLARRAAYRGGKPKAFMYCPSWSGFGTVRGHRFHGGVDVSAPTGTAVRAATAGTLSYAHDPGGYGLFARLRFPHPKRDKSGACEGSSEVEIVYAHLAEGSQKGTKTSRQVHAGEVIGHVGCTGNARGMCSPSPESHLHVTVQRADGDRRKLDPVAFFGWAVGDGERGAEWTSCGAR